MVKSLTIFIQKSATSVMNAQKANWLSQTQALNKLRLHSSLWKEREEQQEGFFQLQSQALCPRLICMGST